MNRLGPVANLSLWNDIEKSVKWILTAKIRGIIKKEKPFQQG